MGVALVLDEGQLAEARIGLAQPHAELLRQTHQSLARPELGIGREHHCLRLHRGVAPIVEGNKLVGIVTRANILQALASATKKLPSLTTADDSELRKKVLSRLAAEPWRPTMLTVTVHDGTVDLWGLVHSVEQKK